MKLGRIPLLIIDEVGYIPFGPEATNPFFRLISSRYDDVVAAAMIGRLVHHAEVISLKSDSYRLKGRDLGRVPAAANTND